MKYVLYALPLLLIAFMFFRSRPGLTVDEAARRIASGEAVLIDVREPDEWAASGVAAPAKLLPLSDFQGSRSRWTAFLAGHRDKELIVYCRSGMRSSGVVNTLQREGFRATNLGGFSKWAAAGQPVRKP